MFLHTYAGNVISLPDVLYRVTFYTQIALETLKHQMLHQVLYTRASSESQYKLRLSSTSLFFLSK